MDDEKWTLVENRKNRQKRYSNEIEFAVELLPSHAFGLRRIVDKFGIDTDSNVTTDAYATPYLFLGMPSGTPQRDRVNRKVSEEGVPMYGNITSNDRARGFVNACPNFVHGSLLFVNPPSEMTFQGASAYIQTEMLSELKSVSNMEPPELTFSGKIRKGEGKGHRAMYRISSSASSISEKQFIARIRSELTEVFQKHKFKARSPYEEYDELHITLRDERYETKILPRARSNTPKYPDQAGNLKVVFDKLAVTPAAETHARHSFSKTQCGATLCLNIFPGMSCISAYPKCFVEGTYFPCPDGSKIPIDKLQPHHILSGVHGTNIEVLSVQKHDVEERDLTYFETQGNVKGMLVTSDHRIVVPRRKGSSTLAARCLDVGDCIMTAEGEERLSSVELITMMACAYEVKFRDDAPVETFFDGAVLTKGAADPLITIRRGGKKAKQNRLRKASLADLETHYDGDPPLHLRLSDMIP